MARKKSANKNKTNQQNPYSFENVVSTINQNFGLIMLIGISFVIGFLVGSLWTENQLLKSNKISDANQPQVAGDQPQVPAGPSEETLKKVPKVSKDDHIRGKQNAKIVLIEYSDYECPFCSRFHPNMKQIRDEYGDDVAWVYRHYPLEMLHPNAKKAAETSECVAKYAGNEAFWQFSDTIYERISNDKTITSEENLLKLAGEVGANSNQIKNCLDGGEMTAVVEDQQAGGSNAGIGGTPGTILVTKDGKYELISGAQPVEQLKTTIEKYL
ncbi:MAG: thioredoxin domain-containing protein [Candidatus Pacebacteria bacterium]|nr:thioredoxin domain-containing protein [Candidatus Paceibacterota bacterium]